MPLPFSLPSPLPGPLDEENPYEVTESASGGGDGTLTALSDFTAQHLALLISEYQEKPHIAALLSSYLDRLAEIDRATASLYENALSIDRALGVHLDALGKILGEPRSGRGDEPYRRALRVRVLVNRSQGRIEDLNRIASLFEDSTVHVREYQPKRVIVIMTDPPINPSRDLHARLRRAKDAGVALQTITHPAATSAPRRFVLGRTTPDPTDTLTGLGWTGDGRGGALGHVLG